jgi:ribose 5-phosphate isomerase A
MTREADQRAAAAAALEEVREGMRLGLGSGTTAAWFVRLLGARVRAGLRVVGVPTSSATRELAAHEGIPLAGFDRIDELDLCVDGADEIDPRLRLIKGAGGALLHEKIVASAARRRVIIADGTKRVARLGAAPLPVEVVAFGAPVVARRLHALGAVPSLRRLPGGEPYLTDEGNYIFDCRFGALDDPDATAAALSALPGVVEHGLFLGLADVALVADGGVVRPVRAYND